LPGRCCRGETGNASPEGEDRMGPTDEDRMSTLERRCRLLMRAYPAAYRSERGDEIIATLLEVTPEGRTWPLPRDIRALATGGLHARAAVNRRATTAANLRVAVFAGVAAYLAEVAAGILASLLYAAGRGTLDLSGRNADPFAWPMLVVPALIAMTLVLAWVSRRRTVVLAGALPAAAATMLAGPWQWGGSGAAVTDLAALAALVALVGAKRPDRPWLWFIGLIVLARLLIAGLTADGVETLGVLGLSLLLAMALASIVWLAIDARLAIAMVVFLLGTWLPSGVNNLAAGAGISASVPVLAICAALATLAVWRLRHQSADPGRPGAGLS
jgi:hypothetical protein